MKLFQFDVKSFPFNVHPLPTILLNVRIDRRIKSIIISYLTGKKFYVYKRNVFIVKYLSKKKNALPFIRRRVRGIQKKKRKEKIIKYNKNSNKRKKREVKRKNENNRIYSIRVRDVY